MMHGEEKNKGRKGDRHAGGGGGCFREGHTCAEFSEGVSRVHGWESGPG